MYFCKIFFNSKRIKSITIHHHFFFVFIDVTFNKSESYFPASYLLSENSIEEDKDQDLCFIYPFLIDPLKVFDLVLVSFFFEPELSSIDFALENQMTRKVTQGRKLHFLSLYKFKNLNRFLEMR